MPLLYAAAGCYTAQIALFEWHWPDWLPLVEMARQGLTEREIAFLRSSFPRYIDASTQTVLLERSLSLHVKLQPTILDVHVRALRGRPCGCSLCTIRR